MASKYPLKIAILWHMHQPFYYDPLKGMFTMPWVRLHSTKDYLDMLLITENYEKVKPIFNLTPSLLLQIQMYLEGVPELHIELSLKDPKECSPTEKLLILKDFFMANWDTMIKPFPRYYELLSKRGKDASEEALKDSLRYFTNQDFIDLQVFFNLTWIDPIFRNSDDFLKYLVEKKSHYTFEEKRLLIEKHFEIMSRIFKEYGKAAKENRIEISTSPFFHPILPLLIDNYVAQQADPDMKLPYLRFQRPEDAEQQIKDALDFIETQIGVRPVGMWPSEGSVSNDTLNLMSSLGILWTATDEQVLLNTLNKGQRKLSTLSSEQLYKPYLYLQSKNPVNIFFRDHRLSDNIGFVFSKMKPQDAVNHFLKSLYEIRDHIPNQNEENIVSIILDGENAWEFYEEDGYPFLKSFYEAIERSKDFEIVTFKEHLKHSKTTSVINNIAPGSWINGNFKIWIGHKEDNEAWILLTKAREEVEVSKNFLNKDSFKEIMRHIYVAEGSDWCWWYGDEHSTEFDVEFDELFRNNLKKIYLLLGKKYPHELDLPIISKEKIIVPDKDIMSFVTPKIDGKISSYFEWMGSYELNLKKFGFAMHRITTYMETLYIGIDANNIYFRLDPESNFSQLLEKTDLKIEIIFPHKKIAILGEIGNNIKAEFNVYKEHSLIASLESAFERILEIKLPRDIGNFVDNEKMEFFINIQPLTFIENIRFPGKGLISVLIPAHNFEAYLWQA